VTNTKHAKLSASGAHRYMHCPGSVRMEEGLPGETSVYAEYGTAAHELAAECLKTDKPAAFYIGDRFNEIEVDDEMVEGVQIYLDYLQELGGDLLIEIKVDFSIFVPGGFGTADAIAFDAKSKTLTIVDLKFGKGIQVDAENNPQITLYALGALNDFDFIYDIENIRMIIVQPRLDHISEWEISKEKLIEEGNFIGSRAQDALRDDAPITPGEVQCRFCKAKGICLPLAEHNISIAFGDLDESTPKDPLKLDNNEIAEILVKSDLISGWLKAVRKRAWTELNLGREISGYKLVVGKTNRKWSDESAVEKALKRAKLKVDQIYTKKVISPAQAEKLLGKNHPAIEKHAIKPEGTPTLVPEPDKRPAILNSVEEDFKELFL
jgi:hypothetical protein